MRTATCRNCEGNVSRGAVLCRRCYRRLAGGPGGKLHSDESSCPDCGGPMHRQSQRCQRCATRGDKRRFPAGAKPSQRICAGCGGLRNRSVKLCRDCWNASLRGDKVKRGQARAERLYSLDGVQCEHEGCKAPARDRHHIDSDTLNNAPENIALYCRRHHMLVDGRLKRFAEQQGARGRGRSSVPRDSGGRFNPTEGGNAR